MMLLVRKHFVRLEQVVHGDRAELHANLSRRARISKTAFARDTGKHTVFGYEVNSSTTGSSTPYVWRGGEHAVSSR